MYVDLTNIHKKYKGLWIALTNNEKRVISSGQDAKSVYEDSLKKGYKAPILFKVPKNLTPFVGNM